MRLERDIIVCCLLTCSLLLVAGCGKKTDEDKSASPAMTETKAETVEAEKPVSEVQAEAGTVDIEKPVSEVQAEAEMMSIENLKATALKYKEAILAKQGTVAELAAKIKEIPVGEALGQEAQSLKTDLKEVESALAALKERFQVYYDTLKEKGGDLSGLEV
jgi:hypothetical protein